MFCSTLRRAAFAAAVGVALFTATPASAAVVFSQGFETDTSGWTDGGSYGTVTRVPSGTGGITSAAGGFHAIMTQSDSGPYTNFGGYQSTWPGQFVARAAIYLDPAMTAGEGFDYSVAASNSGGGHLRDFIFHVASDISTGQLLVGGSNNTNFAPRQDLETINHYEVTSAGWYTFEHLFRDDGGVLAVDLNLYDSGGNLLFTETRSNPTDLIGVNVGGNRYGWFTNIDVTGGIAVDNTQLDVGLAPVPEPATLAVFGAFGLTALGYRGRRKARA